MVGRRSVDGFGSGFKYVPRGSSGDGSTGNCGWQEEEELAGWQHSFRPSGTLCLEGIRQRMVVCETACPSVACTHNHIHIQPHITTCIQPHEYIHKHIHKTQPDTRAHICTRTHTKSHMQPHPHTYAQPHKTTHTHKITCTTTQNLHTHKHMPTHTHIITFAHMHTCIGNLVSDMKKLKDCGTF